MPWWVWLYIVAVAAVTAGGCFDDLKDRRPAVYATLGVLSGIAPIIGTLGYWRGLPTWGVPCAWLVIFALACGWELVAGWMDVRSSALSRGEKWAGTTALSALFLPGYVLAFVAAGRACAGDT